MKDVIIKSIKKQFQFINVRINDLDDKKQIFEFVNEFSNATLLKLEISNIQSNLIVHVIIKFKLTISIREFRLNDLSENHLIIIKLIDFDYFNNEDVNEDSI